MKLFVRPVLFGSARIDALGHNPEADPRTAKADKPLRPGPPKRGPRVTANPNGQVMLGKRAFEARACDGQGVRGQGVAAEHKRLKPSRSVNG